MTKSGFKTKAKQGKRSYAQPVAESATNLRYQALQLMLQLRRHGGSLTRLLPEAQTRVSNAEQSQLQAWIFGWCRWTHELEALVDQLLDKPLKAKDFDVYLLMQLGVFQLRHTPTVVHAAVDETVKVIEKLKKPWARGLVNAVLRNYQRQRDQLDSALTPSGQYSHPDWLIERFQQDWPKRWEAICTANNVQAPMCLRVNALQSDLDGYLQQLKEVGIAASKLNKMPHALLLDSPVAVTQLPGFEEGHVSVQDAAAQLANLLLSKHIPAGGRLLDACAAPGGKAAHAAESGLFSSITAIDHDEDRLGRVASTLQRLMLQADVDVVHADAAAVDQWWDRVPFDAVLLDAPCSGSGVIRRHPDIKLLRRASDIAPLVETQRRLLDGLWQTLATDGVLLYATCSILKDENERQITAFLQCTQDAELLGKMQQIFPGEQQMDGFFYAAIQKCAQ
ncbi:MAG: 16S rRNA (cytosine(967)-C(5))-methyltransferase RsmB [Granulosicoccus sp.]